MRRSVSASVGPADRSMAGTPSRPRKAPEPSRSTGPSSSDAVVMSIPSLPKDFGKSKVEGRRRNKDPRCAGFGLIHPSAFSLYSSLLRGIHRLGLLGDHVPAKRGIDRRAAVAAHPAAAVVVRQQRADAPAHGIDIVIDLQPIHPVPDEFGRPAAFGADDRLVGTPTFEDDDSERLIP